MDSENITITQEQVHEETPVQEEPTNVESSPFVPKEGQAEIRLVDVEVKDDNIALNLMVSYLNVAQKRGTFNLDESAKIWECVQRFIVQRPNQQ